MIYDRIAANKRNSIILFIVFFLFNIFLGWIFGEILGLGYFGLIIAFIIALVMIFSAFYKSDALVLSISKAKPVLEKEFPHLFHSVEGLALAAGIPKPKLYMIDDTAINAFATGRDPQHAVIVVTKGAATRLNRLELEGVLAHEMSHIKNYDIRFMMLVTVMIGTTALLSNIILRSFLWGGVRGNRRGGGQLGLILVVVGLVLAILTPFIAQIIRFAISRKREFLADADGALLTRYPKGLADALRKISADVEPLEVANEATENLYISNPFKKKHKSWFKGMFNTHPPLDERIAALDKM
ncbi:M48 family metallopeptidase [Candidatus Micrarchaeota archaeon]|nr:M48 family metallopeptidase [Candidatus Micrarchaeota archaeon]MBU2476497.1 M48 family metallopeptidase [Candidatus Micrarchaeota archaeon]